MGYRAPWGNISKEGLARLSKKGFKYDSSLIPSYRPGVFNNFSIPLEPYKSKGIDLIEIPFSVIPGIRLPLGMSYLKFFGLPFYRPLFDFCGAPNPLIFYMHLHDFKINEELLSRQPLARWEKAYHSCKVDKAFDILEGFLKMLKKRGYSFIFMSDLYKQVTEKLKSPI